MWNRQGEEIKTIYVIEVEERGKIIVPAKTAVVTPDGHKTLLQMSNIVLDQKIDPALFTLQNLER